MADALRAGLKIYHYPKTICIAEEGHLLQKEEDVKEYLLGKGGSFFRIYKGWFWLFSLGFIIKKKRSLFNNVTICQAYKWMKQGKKQYKEIKGKS